MKWLIASDIHGSSFYCKKLIEAFKNEKADNSNPSKRLCSQMLTQLPKIGNFKKNNKSWDGIHQYH